MKVLLVEDHEDFAAAITALLAHLAANVRYFDDGKDAVEYIADPSVELDLVITDLSLPRRTGWHIIGAVQQHRPGTPVILQTGEAGDLWVQDEASRLGVPLIPKMRIAEVLLQTIARVIPGTEGTRRGDRGQPD